MTTYRIPLKPMSKPRPQPNRWGGFRNNEAFDDWKAEMRAAIVARYGTPQPLEGLFRVDMVFRSKTRARGDLDNQFAGVMDALQPPGAQGHQGDPSLYPGVLWVDDRNLREFSCRWEPAHETEIELTVEEVAIAKLPPKPRKRKGA